VRLLVSLDEAEPLRLDAERDVELRAGVRHPISRTSIRLGACRSRQIAASAATSLPPASEQREGKIEVTSRNRVTTPRLAMGSPARPADVGTSTRTTPRQSKKPRLADALPVPLVAAPHPFALGRAMRLGSNGESVTKRRGVAERSEARQGPTAETVPESQNASLGPRPHRLPPRAPLPRLPDR
jgi:hypothetical protein